MKILLIGYMGSGKSSVGKQLATSLNLPFLDLDTEIEQKEGISIAQIFDSKGEIYFRKIEIEVLKNLLAKPTDFVLATGGGTPCYSNTMQLMLKQPNCAVVYLKTSLHELTDRLYSQKANRPLISHLNSKEVLEDFIRKHLFERAYYYNQAEVVVDNTSSIENTVQKIKKALL
ncbi:MAG: shikimate kinase [Aequorivita sp.]|nr:shikimate kinase [Aequorivita sp.]|tara:strand:+ start:78 stop:596 length:519 start_codon:yes stop_codon:yes gene_type:complete